MKRLLPFAIIVIVLGAVLFVGLQLWRSVENETAASPNASSRVSEMAPAPGAAPAHIRGLVTASVTLEEFADFECPACGKFYPLLKSIEREYGTRVRLVFRQFPLVQHPRGVVAAQAAEAAGLQNKFWEMHDKLYENRATWTEATDLRPLFEAYARELGLDVERFKRDQSGEAVRTRVNLDHQRARSLRVKSTPTLYLNGVEVPYNQVKTLEGLRAVLDNALKARSSSP